MTRGKPTDSGPWAAEGKGVEPSSPVRENRISRAARPTVSGYLPKWTAGELNPDSLGANQVSYPLDQQPGIQESGVRNQESGVRNQGLASHDS